MNREELFQTRQVTLQLSDEHCEEILRVCGSRNLTVSQLLETFLKDLLGEEPSVFESNECALAKRWLEEYDFYHKPNNNLLVFLHEYGVDVQEFSQLGYNIDITQETLKNVMFLEEDEKNIRAELKAYEEEFNDYKSRFLKENPDADWEKELKEVRTWLSAGCQFLYPCPEMAEPEESFL